MSQQPLCSIKRSKCQKSLSVKSEDLKTENKKLRQLYQMLSKSYNKEKSRKIE